MYTEGPSSLTDHSLGGVYVYTDRMKAYEVRTYASSEQLPQEEQLAWRIAQVAADPVAVRGDVAEMIVNRVIDNAAVAELPVVALEDVPVAGFLSRGWDTLRLLFRSST